MAVRYTKNGKKVGRPNGTGKLRTPENADYICELLEQGLTVRQIAQEIGFTQPQISQWGSGSGDQPRDEVFINRYARSMLSRWEQMAEELIEISDETAPIDTNGHVDTGWVQQQRLRSDNRKWLLSKALPRKYGDKVEATVIGDPNAPLLTRIELVAVPPRARIEDSRDGKTIDHEPDADE